MMIRKATHSTAATVRSSKMGTIIFFVTLLFLAGKGTPVTGQMVSTYTHNFAGDANSSSLPAGWSVVTGTMRIQGGQLQCTTGPCIAIYNGTTFANDQFATIKVSGYTATIGQGVVLRETSGSAYYKTACTTASSGTCSAVRIYRVATTLTTISSLSIAGSTGTQTLAAQGTNLALYANGSSVGNATDSTYTSGYPGVYFAGTSTTNGITYFEAGYVGNPQAETPVISPATGTYAGIQSVTITDATSGATICYTTDGSTPTSNGSGTCTNGSTYSGAFNVGTLNTNSTITVKAIASKSGNSDSNVASNAITVQYGPTPSISPAAGTYYSQQTITITCSAATPHYTTDGSTPTVSSTTYSGTFSGTASGSQTIKAVCADSTNAAGPVASNAYTILPPDFTPSDVTVFTSNFSDVYDTNLELNHVQQKVLDYGPTQGKYTALVALSGDMGVGYTPSNGAIAPVPSSVCTASSGYCVTTNSSTPVATIYTGKTGINAEQWAEIKSAGPISEAYSSGCVRASTNGNAYCALLLTTANPTGATVDLYKVSGGVWNSVSGATGFTFPVGSTSRIRASQNAIQVVANGSVVLTYADTSSPYMTGTCGFALKNSGAAVQSFSCGNIGTADATSPATLTYPTYTDAAMSTSAWTMGYPWFQAQITSAPPGGPYWSKVFAPYLIGGSLYGLGLTTAGPATMSYRGGLFGSDQWQKYKVGIEPNETSVMNWFTPLQHQTYVPGSSGACAAAGGATLAHCYDSVSYYPGVETFGLDPGYCSGSTKPEYACTPYMHITKVTPAASPADEVVTVAGSFYTPRKGDEIFVEYRANRLMVACKGNASNYVSWQANHAYTVGTFIVDSNGFYQMVKTSGTSASSHPTWYAGWNATTNTGETTNDGTVVWESFGKPCDTTSTFSWQIVAPDTDLAGAPGIPALWLQEIASTPVFYDWSAGTAIASTSTSVIGISEPSSYQPAPVIFW